MKSNERVTFAESETIGKQKLVNLEDADIGRKTSDNEQPGALEARNPASDSKNQAKIQAAKKPAWSRPSEEQQGVERQEDEELLEYMGNLDL